MSYTSYEIILLIVLIISLVIKIPISLFNKFFLLILATWVVLNPTFDENFTNWEHFIKLTCLIFGLICVNFDKEKVISSSKTLILCVLLASMLIISSTNLLTLYLCLELQSLAVFVLLGQNRRGINTIESSIKYFVLSSISSGIFLLGSSLIFVNTGSCDLTPLSNNTYMLEKTLITVALLFKLAASPFHFWVPDVYQGSQNKVLLVLGTIPKISVFGVFLMLFPNNKLVLLSTVLSLVIGSIGAINQAKFKRLLGYSSILAIGFVFLGMNTLNTQGIEGSVTYILIYLITFGGVIITAELTIKEHSSIAEFSKLISQNRVLLVAFSALLLSIIGIPPLAGFYAKWMVISAAVSSNFILSSLLSVTCAMIAGLYYLRLVKIGYFQENKVFLMWKEVLLNENKANYTLTMTLGVIVYFLCFFLIYPHSLYELVHYTLVSVF
uniref:NADH dehydrogenase subunit 2 n=1 Tax=Thysanostoma flagellatum TaxID=3287591 RepID=UPI001FA7D19C|nr:NADH dehydrogenase subunit 2 [Acromitus flagellatus]UMY76049.1 NADH dehydrogenase subunit 2 [Acromitus flagellatus]